MSVPLWCDKGGHLFLDGDDENSEGFLSTNTKGDRPRRRFDVCGPCAMGQPVKVLPLALESAEPTVKS